MVNLTATPLDIARALFQAAIKCGHLMTPKEAAEIASILHDVYFGIRTMPRKGWQQHFDTLILERAGDYAALRVKGASEHLIVFSNQEWLAGAIHIDPSEGDDL